MNMTLTLKLFGSFRNYGQELTLEVPENGQVSDLRLALLESLKKQEPNEEALKKLISTSRFATDKAVLEEEDYVKNINELAILPPVSGGAK